VCFFIANQTKQKNQTKPNKPLKKEIHGSLFGLHEKLLISQLTDSYNPLPLPYPPTQSIKIDDTEPTCIVNL
jgi:hypothetical protein